MQIKSIAMMAVAGCVIALSTGCVKQEEYDNMVTQLTSEKTAAVDEVKRELADKDSLLKAADEKVRTLTADLRDSSALNAELKEQVKELKTSIADANSKASSLESKLSSAKAGIKSAQAQASEAESARATAEMKAQETQRRFEALIENLIRLNKIKPEDVGFDSSLGGGMDMGSGMGSDMGSDMGMEDSQDGGSAADLLDEMGNM